MKTITRESMIEPILAASPSFTPVWAEFLEEWADEPGELPLYLVLSDLARHADSLLRASSESELKLIFAAVEDWHVRGDSYVREAATIGFLEDLQNTNLVAEDSVIVFENYLGPESLRWWRKVQTFWERGELVSDA